MINYLFLDRPGHRRAEIVAQVAEEIARANNKSIGMHSGVMPCGQINEERGVWLNSHQAIFVMQDRMVQGARIRGYDGPIVSLGFGDNGYKDNPEFRAEVGNKLLSLM